VTSELAELVARALAEDLGDGDVTSAATVPEDARAHARLIQKQPGVIYGLELAAETFRQAGAEELQPVAAEGEWRDDVPAAIATIGGPARALLAGERVALNFLAHLSGVATLTARFVEAVAGSGATILDTRKTTPGLRALEKAAVVAGGGTNHRMGLDDAILIKDNHVEIAGGVARAVELAQAAQPSLEIEVECRDAAEVEGALAAGAERLLLDNMNIEQLRAAVAERDRAGRPATLEASGGITLDNVAAVAATGVDYISIGALTHSAPALDLSLLLDASGDVRG
jgi:nicotinate-nucleotide pyrophosphorylase (carboxylating)